MDNRTIFTKTAKGLGESIGKTKALSRESRKVIIEVNGVAAFKDLLIKLDQFSEEKLTEILSKLKAGDYIREFNPPPVTGDDQNHLAVEAKIDDALTALTMGAFLRELAPPAQSLDFTGGGSMFPKTEIDARHKTDTGVRGDIADKNKERDTQIQQKLNTRSGKESDNKKQRETAAKEKREADELTRKLEKKKKEQEAEEQVWQKFEAKAKEQDDALARQKEEEEALKSILEMQQLEAQIAVEERARIQTKIQTEIQVEENTKKVAEEKARMAKIEKEKKETEEAEKKLAAAQKQQDDEDKAWRKFEEKARKEAEEKLQRELEKIAEEFALQAIQDQAKKEAEEKARLEAELQTQLRDQKEAEEKARRKAQEVAEELARQTLAKLEHEEIQRKEAEEKAQREAEKTAAAAAAALIKRQKIEARQQKEADDKAKRELDLKNKKDAAERTRLEALAKKELEEQAQKEANEKVMAEAAELARQTIEQEKIEAEEEQTRADIAEKLRLAAKAQAHARQEEEQAQRDAEEQAALLAEESANLAAQEQILINAAREHALQQSSELAAGAESAQTPDEEIERQARLAAENQDKLELDLQAKKAADEIAEKLEEIANEKRSEAANAQEMAAHKAQEQARLNAAAQEREKSRQEAVAATQARREQRTRAKLEQKKQRESERKARRNNQEIAPVSTAHFYDTSRGLGMTLIGICFVAIVVLFAWTQFSSFDEKIVQFEKTAGQQFQQQVKINKLGFSLLPQPRWQFENVVIGAQGQIKIAQINAPLDLSSLFSDATAFNSLELLSPVFNEEGLGWLLFGRSRKQESEVNHLTASNIKVNSAQLDLGVFDLDAKIDTNRGWDTINLVSPNKEMTIELQNKDGQVQVKLNSKSFALPFGSSLNLGSFSAEGTMSNNALILSKFYGVIYDGILTGSAKLTWDKDWVLKGDIKAKQIDAAKYLPELLEDGQIEGDGKFLMQAAETKKLFPSQRMNGNFSVRNGTIRGLDMVKLLQGIDNTGTSSFKDLSGGFFYDAGKIRLRNVNLAAGLVSASGYIDLSANQEMSGRFGVDLTTPVRNVRVDLLVSGALKKPHFSSSSTNKNISE